MSSGPEKPPDGRQTPDYEPDQWPEAQPTAATKPPSTTRGPRWGVRTLWFLAIAALAILVSIEQGGTYTIFSFALLLIGFIGATYCSIRGLIANTGDRGH